MTTQVVELETAGNCRYAIQREDGSFVTSAISSPLPITFNSFCAAMIELRVLQFIGGRT